MRTVFTLLLMTSIYGSASCADDREAEHAVAELRGINHRYVDTFRRHDPQFMIELVDGDFVATTHRGEWLGRDAHLGIIQRTKPFAQVSYDDVDVRVFGDVALVHGLFRGLRPGEDEVAARYTDIYRRDAVTWRLISAQDTLVPTASSWRRRSGTVPATVPWRGNGPKGEDAQVLRVLNENYVRAFRESDVAWYDAHLAPDYVVINGDGSYGDRSWALQQFAQPTFERHLRSFPVDKVNIRQFGDVAVIHAENDFEMKDGRRGISRYTDVWRKRDGRWLCIAAHITTHRAPR